MRVLIFGLGTLGGGFAAAKYFLDKGDEVRITDLRSESVLGGPLAILKSKGAMSILQEHRKEDLLWADIVIKNPAVAATHPLLEFATRVESDLSFLFTSSLMKGIDVIAITGTKGKTTTAAATAHVLGQCGFEAMQCGNMGISGFSVLTELQARFDSGRPMPRYVVCELSSWQIRDLYCSTGNHMPQFKIVVMTSLFPDHLNSYGDFNAYKHDKWLLLSSKSNQILVSQDLFDDVKANATLGSNKLLAIESIPGAKRIETRFQPTWAICRRLGIQSKQLASALGSFRGVPHRQEQVAMGGNIVFINDSSATIPEAVSFSTTSCPWQYVLICGGTDKNLLAEPMLNALKRALSIHILDGSFTRNKLLPLLQAHELDYQGPFGTMKEAFDSALASAQAVLGKRSDKPIVAVMLSPGAASFVFFKHEFDRGDQFKALAIEAAGKLSGLV